jgi:choline dehydrogenase-like flavoprotein
MSAPGILWEPAEWSPNNSVVNSFQQAWEHENLYVAGNRMFPTGATANPTLTIATADKILREDLR